MIPLLEPTGCAAGTTLNVPPPRFKHVTGPIREIRLQPQEYVRQRGTTASQEMGRRYESQVQSYLEDLFMAHYVPEPVISFTDNGLYRTVRPDGVLIEKDFIVIFEIKYQHVPEAWWQLEKLYKVVLDGLYHRPVSLVEICRSYDPATPFPCEVEFIPDLESWVSVHRPAFGVYQWRKPQL